MAKEYTVPKNVIQLLLMKEMSTINFLAVDFEFTVYTSNTFGRPRAFFPEVIEVGAVVTDEFGKPNGEKYSAFVKPRLAS